MSIRNRLEELITDTLSELTGEAAPAQVRQAGRPEYGHYQANGVMTAAGRKAVQPRRLAERLLQALAATPLADMTEQLEVAGPGFINIRLKRTHLEQALAALRDDERLQIQRQQAETLVVDYSSPNLAKEMHVGHIRSTIIGDTLVRMLEFQGHRVLRANHVGDWGAQFGSLLAQLDEAGEDSRDAELQDLEAFYRKAAARFKEDAAFAARARNRVVQLQQGEPDCMALWRHFVDESARHCQNIYDRLGVTLTREDMYGESFYKDELPRVMAELDARELLTRSDGAGCVFLPGFTGKEGKPLPAILQKSDGGYPYLATDLAAVRYRAQKLGAKRALYVVGAPQSLHLRQLFAVAEAAGYLREEHDFRHLAFGSITNEDKIPFKTRAGGTVKLAGLLDEAEARALEVVAEKSPGLNPEARREVARAVSIAAVKYAELSRNRTSDYVFSWEQLLSFDGNTGPYLLYAYARICSIFRRDGVNPEETGEGFCLEQDAEVKLGLKLLQFPEAFDAALEDYHPNLLCNYLFELAGDFTAFYEACPVLKASPPLRASRLQLCRLTAETLRQGLDFLGIKTLERM